MAEDWDLHAVVRGCATSNVLANDQNNFSEDFVTDFDSHTFENENFNFCDSSYNEHLNFQGLEEVYKSFNSPQQSQLRLPYSQATVGPITPVFHSPSPSRARKNQQAKVVREMTHEELQTDSWAWRKYGQKPIKGSPYPRNYYRCSTSKTCIARKQVEKSAVDPNIYIVSYSGNHSHPRPTHRNSLAGSTRNKSTGLSVPSSSPMMEIESASLSRETYENDGVVMEDDEEEQLIPNDDMNEDTLMGIEELGEDMNKDYGDYTGYYAK